MPQKKKYKQKYKIEMVKNSTLQNKNHKKKEFMCLSSWNLLS
jgi:hypothetical protein